MGTYVASPEEKERRLRLLESAAASAINNGATPEEARARVEVGIAEAVQLKAIREGRTAPPPPPPAETSTIDPDSAVGRLIRSAKGL